jgi:hypothetical protein
LKKRLKQSLALILKRLESALNLADDPKQEQKPEEEREPANQQGDRLPVARTVIDIPDAVLQAFERYQEAQNRDNQRNRTIAKWAVAGAWIYAAIALFQWCAMRHTLNETREANSLARRAQSQTEDILRETERPWIGMQSVRFSNFTINQKPSVSVEFNNSGKGPALDVNSVAELFVYERLVSPNESPLYEHRRTHWTKRQ